MKEKIASLAIVANIVLAGGKITVGIFSNSAAVLAGGIDSLADIFASIISFIGIKISGKPADEKHPYGHYKFEVLSGTIITVFILATGAGIIYDAVQEFFNPKEINLNYLVFGVMIFSVVVNLVMSKLKIYYGKKENSVSLVSDGVHSRLDVYTSLAILAGVILARFWVYADPLIAILMGLYIIKEAFSIGRDAVGSLLDVSAGEEIENEIKKIAQEEKIEISSLKTQKKGSAVTANLEIKLDKNLTVDEAAKISNQLREKLINNVENLQYVAIQIDTHEVSTSFYKPSFGKSIGWQKRGRFKEEIGDAEGKGPGGYCICEKCGYKIIHQKGTPCSSLECPKCKVNLQRE